MSSLSKKGRIRVYSKLNCPWCKKATDLLEEFDSDIDYELIYVDGNDKEELRKRLIEETEQKTVPNIFIGKYHVGGCSHLENLISTAEIDEILETFF